MATATLKATGRARPANRPTSALSEPTGELATVPAASSTTYTPQTRPPAVRRQPRWARRRPPRPAPAVPANPSASSPAPAAAPPAASWRPRMGTSTHEIAGFILAFLAWGWVAMPFIQSGPAGVRKVLKAKFTNKAPDGSWLP